jgi:2-methylcitrate dehydratase PrpD
MTHDQHADVPGDGSHSIVAMTQSLTWEDLPQPVREAARRHLLDSFGTILAGMRRDVAGLVARVQVGAAIPNGIPIPGSELRLPPEAFAFLCGSAAHGIELDDGYRLGSVHPGVAVVPALLAAAAERRVEGKALLTALVIGYEVVCAIGGAAHPALRDRGFHPTPAVGPLGASMAVARLLGLSESQTTSALGIAASDCGGLFAFLGGGGDVKRLHGGKAARGGLMAALYAAQGISAPAAILERPSGYAQAFAGAAPGQGLAFVLPPVGPFRILDCYVKPHACCRHLQPAMEALIDLRGAEGLVADEVERIDVETYSIAAKHAATGWSDFASAQLSFPYVLALGLEIGRADLEHFDEAVRSQPWVDAIAARIHIRATEEMDALYPRQRPSRVTVKTARGSFSAFKPEALGCRELPLDNEALQSKFLRLASPVLGEARASRLMLDLWSIERCEDVRKLLSVAAG